MTFEDGLGATPPRRRSRPQRTGGNALPPRRADGGAVVRVRPARTRQPPGGVPPRLLRARPQRRTAEGSGLDAGARLRRDSGRAALGDPRIRRSSDSVTLDIDAALCLLRQLVPAVAMLHENVPDVAHGAIAAERIIVTPGAHIIVVEHVLGSALEQLRFPLERYWNELRIALPRTAGAPRFDHRADVTQLGVVALSLILGRPLLADEVPVEAGRSVSRRVGDVGARRARAAARGAARLADVRAAARREELVPVGGRGPGRARTRARRERLHRGAGDARIVPRAVPRRHAGRSCAARASPHRCRHQSR